MHNKYNQSRKSITRISYLYCSHSKKQLTTYCTVMNGEHFCKSTSQTLTHPNVNDIPSAPVQSATHSLAPSLFA